MPAGVIGKNGYFAHGKFLAVKNREKNCFNIRSDKKSGYAFFYNALS
jgi:hypothetical protein